VTALVILGAAFLVGLMVLMQGAVQSAVLVDSLPTGNTVRTPELGAAWNAMLLGLGLCAISALITVMMIVTLRRRAERSDRESHLTAL